MPALDRSLFDCRYANCAKGDVFFPVNRVVLAGAMWFISCWLLVAVLYYDPQHGQNRAATLNRKERKLSDEQILKAWLTDKPPVGHRGAITFQISHQRRERLHMACESIEKKDLSAGLYVLDTVCFVYTCRRLKSALYIHAGD